MSVQTTRAQIARAKLITGLIALAVMAASCAPQMLSANARQPSVAAAATAR